MGIYSENKHFGYTDDVVANESYVGTLGCHQMLIESVQNDQKFFDAIIANDFQEAAILAEGGDVTTFLEAGATGFFGKIVAFLKKIWEKIKGLFKTLIAQLTNIFTKDGKAFVDKYKKEILSKNMSKFKYKIRPRTGKTIKYLDKSSMEIPTESSVTSLNSATLDKMDKESEDVVEKMLTRSIGGTSTTESDYAKDAMDYEFDDSEEFEGNSKLNDYMLVISGGKKVLDDLKKDEKDANTYYTKLINVWEKVSNKAIKDLPGEGDAAEKARLLNRTANAHKTLYTLQQQATVKILQAKIACAKFDIKQCRAVIVKAAGFNPKAVKENADLLEYVYEDAMHEAETDLCAYGI